MYIFRKKMTKQLQLLKSLSLSLSLSLSKNDIAYFDNVKISAPRSFTRVTESPALSLSPVTVARGECMGTRYWRARLTGEKGRC